MTFKEYLAVRRIRSLNQDKFIRVALSDPSWPDVRDWPNLKKRLIKHGIDSQDIQAAQECWRGYRQLLVVMNRQAEQRQS